MNDAIPLQSLLCLVVVLAVATASLAATYYVSPKGADANPGTARQPFATIGKAAAVMQPGDTCLVRGGVYRETVRPARSGEPGRPITFRACPGERVMVSGADPVTGWQRASGRIYQAPVTRPVEQLFVDGRMMNPARWPNATLDPLKPAWALAAKGSEKGKIVDPKLPAVNLAGARMLILPGAHWVTWTAALQDCDPRAHTLRFDQKWSDDWAYRVQEGTRYYLYGIPALLDSPGEWAMEGDRVLLWAPRGADPARLRVEAKRREWAFDLRERSHIQVEGFLIFAAGITTVAAEHCAIAGCHLRYASHLAETSGWDVPQVGIVLGGTRNVLRDSSLTYSAGNGVSLTGERNTIRNCLIQDVNYMATDAGAIFAEGRGHAIVGNTLRRAGRSILLHRALRHGRIEHNDMSDAGLLASDLGITYCYDTDGEGTVIAYNRVHHNRAESCGVGIYIDNGSRNFVIHHNLSYNNGDSGIRLNTPCHNVLVCNNTAVRNLNGTSWWDSKDEGDQTGCRLVNNIFTGEMRTGKGLTLGPNFQGRQPGFVDSQAGDFRLRPGSPCLAAGEVVPGITRARGGKAPDLGACESSLPAWQAGHDWGEPPVF